MNISINKKQTLSVIIVGMCAAILFVQEQILTFIPNFQFTTVLIILYYKILGGKRTIFIILIHVFLDNIVFGFNIFYFSTMLFAWLSLPLFLFLLLRHSTSEIKLALLGAFHAIVYAFCFALVQLFLFQIDLWAYMVADIPFTVLLIASNYLTILWLFPHLYRRLKPKYDFMINH